MKLSAILAVISEISSGILAAAIGVLTTHNETAALVVAFVCFWGFVYFFGFLLNRVLPPTEQKNLKTTLQIRTRTHR